MAAIRIFDEHGTILVFRRGFLPQRPPSFRRYDGVLQGDGVEEAAVEIRDFPETIKVIFDEPIHHPSGQTEEVIHHFEGVVLKS